MALRKILMWTQHPIIVAQLAYVDKSLCHITVWCKLTAIKFSFLHILPLGTLGPKIFAKETSLQFKALYSGGKELFCGPGESGDDVCDGQAWWRSATPWPAVSSVYERCHHGWQPSRAMIYTHPNATGTCRAETRRLARGRRRVELSRAKKVSLMPARVMTLFAVWKFQQLERRANISRGRVADMSIIW